MFVVAVYDSGNLVNHVSGVRGDAYSVMVPYKTAEFRYDDNKWLMSQLVFASNEQAAASAAGEMAKANPGKDVVVSKLFRAFGSPVSPVVEKKVSEKGILPV